MSIKKIIVTNSGESVEFVAGGRLYLLEVTEAAMVAAFGYQAPEYRAGFDPDSDEVLCDEEPLFVPSDVLTFTESELADLIVANECNWYDITNCSDEGADLCFILPL